MFRPKRGQDVGSRSTSNSAEGSVGSVQSVDGWNWKKSNGRMRCSSKDVEVEEDRDRRRRSREESSGGACL